MPSSSNGSGASPVPPAQPTQVPWCSARTGCSAVTRPPGLRRHCRPSSVVTSSTGRRLATTTNELRTVTLRTPPVITGPPSSVLAGVHARDALLALSDRAGMSPWSGATEPDGGRRSWTAAVRCSCWRSSGPGGWHRRTSSTSRAAARRHRGGRRGDDRPSSAGVHRCRQRCDRRRGRPPRHRGAASSMPAGRPPPARAVRHDGDDDRQVGEVDGPGPAVRPTDRPTQAQRRDEASRPRRSAAAGTSLTAMPTPDRELRGRGSAPRRPAGWSTRRRTARRRPPSTVGHRRDPSLSRADGRSFEARRARGDERRHDLLTSSAEMLPADEERRRVSRTAGGRTMLARLMLRHRGPPGTIRGLPVRIAEALRSNLRR